MGVEATGELPQTTPTTNNTLEEPQRPQPHDQLDKTLQPPAPPPTTTTVAAETPTATDAQAGESEEVLAVVEESSNMESVPCEESVPDEESTDMDTTTESVSVESPSDLTIPSKSDTSVLSEDDQAANDAQEVKEVVEEVYKLGFSLNELYKLALEYYRTNKQTLTTMGYADKIQIVALWKQVTAGRFSTSKAPDIGYFDVIGNDRKKAWQALGDMDEQVAKQQFCDLLQANSDEYVETVREKRAQLDAEIERKRVEEEERLRKEEEERKIKEEEERLRLEEERLRKEEEERIRKEEEERVRKEEEERIRREEEDRLKREEEEQLQKELERIRLEKEAEEEKLQKLNEEEEQLMLKKQQQHEEEQHRGSTEETTTAAAATEAIVETPVEADVSNDVGAPEPVQEDAPPNPTPPPPTTSDLPPATSPPPSPPPQQQQQRRGSMTPASLWTRPKLEEFVSHVKGDASSVLIVGRGETVTVRVPTHDKGSCLFWEFATEGYDVGFGVLFEWASTSTTTTSSTTEGISVNVNESDNDEDETPESDRSDTNSDSTEDSVVLVDKPCVQEVLPVLRRNSQEQVIVGSHNYPGRGTYLLKFDNSYSLLRSKTLYYRVYYTK